jgi:hypothetical protein
MNRTKFLLSQAHIGNHNNGPGVLHPLILRYPCLALGTILIAKSNLISINPSYVEFDGRTGFKDAGETPKFKEAAEGMTTHKT